MFGDINCAAALLSAGSCNRYVDLAGGSCLKSQSLAACGGDFLVLSKEGTFIETCDYLLCFGGILYSPYQGRSTTALSRVSQLLMLQVKDTSEASSGLAIAVSML